MKEKEGRNKERVVSDGLLYCSGMIAGEESGWYHPRSAGGSSSGRDYQSVGLLNLSPLVSSIGSLVVFTNYHSSASEIYNLEESENSKTGQIIILPVTVWVENR